MADLPEHISDGFVVLRRADPADVDEIAAAINESHVELRPWMPWAHADYKRHESVTFLATAWLGWNARTSFEFVIRDAVDRRLLGLCGLNDMDEGNRRANLGYWVRTGEAGRGVATAATKLLATYGIEHLKLARVRLFHAVGNIGSGRVAEKAGFLREGTLRSRLVLHDVAHDAVLWSRID
jgi:ribosomal-protein-serine acetyltransferase